jgi:hypothetical protein
MTLVTLISFAFVLAIAFLFEAEWLKAIAKAFKRLAEGIRSGFVALCAKIARKAYAAYKAYEPEFGDGFFSGGFSLLMSAFIIISIDDNHTVEGWILFTFAIALIAIGAIIRKKMRG